MPLLYDLLTGEAEFVLSSLMDLAFFDLFLLSADLTSLNLLNCLDFLLIFSEPFLSSELLAVPDCELFFKKGSFALLPLD